MEKKDIKLTSSKVETLESEIEVLEVEDTAVIVKVEGWRMRIYFDKGVGKSDFHVGKVLKVKHQGKLSNPHELKFERIK